MSRQSHWNKVWTENRESEVSWFQEKPSLSLDLVQRHAADKNARILDVGGGSSRLVDALLASGFGNVGVLDIAAQALEVARDRLGDLASSVEWIVADVTAYKPSHPWDIWHDRAVFHFLVDMGDRQSYVQAMRRFLSPSGVVVIATLGPDGPKKCSGLDVQLYTPKMLSEVFGSGFVLLESYVEMHRTPSGADQQFVYCVFRRDARHDEVESPLQDQVVLRPAEPPDVEVFFEHQLDPEAQRMAAFTSLDPGDQTGFFERWKRILADPTTIKQTVVIGSSVVGHVVRFDRFEKPELAYWIARKWWGKGIATAALMLFLAEHPERPLYARAAADNVRSLRVLKKCGFELIGYERAYANARGEEVLEALLSLS
jgi:RimJ/RimL family protein N-acetyltransferase/2-polyprenyl-3-methyl-5-hydroxy-6-metoxy-1,4-benzoquinol methylase